MEHVADKFNPFTRKRSHYADLDGFLAALVAEEEARKDFIVPDKALEFGVKADPVVGPEGVTERAYPVLRFPGNEGPEEFTLKPHGREQLAEKFGVAQKYAERMAREAPALYGTNFGWWAERSKDTHLVRTIRGQVRAFLSKNYRIVDNLDMAEVVLREVRDLSPAAELFSWGLTEEVMNFAVFNPRSAVRLPTMANIRPEVRKFLEGPLAGTVQDPEYERRGVVERMIIAEGRDPNSGGDYVFPGLVAGNSEVGLRAAWVKVGMFVASCSNRLLVGEDLAVIHLGKDMSKNADAITSRETRRLENAVVFSRIRDAVRAVFNPEEFKRHVANLGNAMSVAVPSPRAAVEAIVAREKWGGRTALVDSILGFWRNEVSTEKATAWDLAQAVTRAAQEHEDPEFVVSMETAAGTLVGLPAKDLAEAVGGVAL